MHFRGLYIPRPECHRPRGPGPRGPLNTSLPNFIAIFIFQPLVWKATTPIFSFNIHRPPVRVRIWNDPRRRDLKKSSVPFRILWIISKVAEIQGHPNGAVTSNDGRMCESCEELDLSVDRFLIGDSMISHSMGRPTPALSRPGYANNATPKSQLNSGHKKRLFGTISQIEGRKESCFLCDLVHRAIKKYSGQSVEQDSECFMQWEVDGREAKLGTDGAAPHGREGTIYSNVSRRIRFWWSQKDEKIQEASILYGPRRDQAIHDPYDDPYANLMRPQTQDRRFLARDHEAEKSNQVLIDSWVGLCKKHHEDTSGRPGFTRRFRDLIQQTSFGVVDVVRMQLCQLPTNKDGPVPFIALSYVWGTAETKHNTVRSNVMQRIQRGGIVAQDLPRTIQQAISLTKDLGLRYIWIDALCNVQGSVSSWKLNAENMDIVYGNAHLTICAADGDNSNAGLAALDPGEIEKPLQVPYGIGSQLLVSRPSENVIRDSVWNQRAWTFQERILSRRCLVFAGKKIYFQCRSSNMSQDVYPDETGTGWSSDWKNSPLRTLGIEWLERQPISFYMKCVSLYTGRRLTKPQDILAAFDGVARLMEPYIQGPLVHGLPPSHFDLALLWEPVNPQERRDAMDFPSWSWAGWMNKGGQKKGAEYKHETLEGCFIDVHEWLLKHTWIRWFIRNRSGDLRPIWAKEAVEHVPGVSHRWRGYSAIKRRHEESGPSVTTTSYSEDEISDEASGTRDMHMIEVEDQRQERPFNRHTMAVSRDQAEYFTDSHQGMNEAEADHARRRRSLEAREQRERWLKKHGEVRPEIQRVQDHERIMMKEQEPRGLRGAVQSQGPATDEYGRAIRKQPDSYSFYGTIPDNPFGVKTATYDDFRLGQDRSVLQFWTWHAQFYVFYSSEARKNPAPGDSLLKYDVADANGDWCGHVVLSKSWMDGTSEVNGKSKGNGKSEDDGKSEGEGEGESKGERSGKKWHFIALSEARSFAGDEGRNWNYYIPKDRDDVEWDLYFVLLIVWNKERRVWERVGTGKVFKAAFDLSLNGWDEILLG